MKKVILLLSALFVAILFFLTACHERKPIFKTVDAAKATTIASKRNIRILDVRTPEEFAEGHLQNAINIDFLNPSFKENINKLDKKKKYLVYCRSGHRSTQAVEMMKENTFKHVTNMKGGFSQWKGTVIK